MYKTKDLFLASYFLANGYDSYSLEKIGTVIYFTFSAPKGKKVDFVKEEDKYWQNDVLIEPKKLFAAYKELRGRIQLAIERQT